MLGVVGQVVSWVLGALQALGYPGLAAVVGLESMGLPLPGETALMADAYLAATGHLSLPLVIGSAALGAMVGDSLGYLVGHKGGRRFLGRYGRYVGVTPQRLARAEGYFARHGTKTVFFGRFFPLLRILAGPLAGASDMAYRRFLAANAVGALTWATTMGTLAYFFGEAFGRFVSSAGLWALVGLVSFAVLYWVLGRLLSRRSASVSGQPRLGDPETAVPVAAQVAAPAKEPEATGCAGKRR